MRALLVYASTHGHTAKIASRLAAAAGQGGCEVGVRDARHDAVPDPAGYEGVIVAGSLHGGHHQREIVDWAKNNRDVLAGLHSILVSVSLTAAEDTEEAQAATQKCIEDFLDETGWQPNRAIPIAGALQYREYDVATRTLIRLMMQKGGHPTDTSHDYDYTDWDSIDRLGAEFAEALRP